MTKRFFINKDHGPLDIAYDSLISINEISEDKVNEIELLFKDDRDKLDDYHYYNKLLLYIIDNNICHDLEFFFNVNILIEVPDNYDVIQCYMEDSIFVEKYAIAKDVEYITFDDSKVYSKLEKYITMLNKENK